MILVKAKCFVKLTLYFPTFTQHIAFKRSLRCDLPLIRIFFRAVFFKLYFWNFRLKLWLKSWNSLDGLMLVQSLLRQIWEQDFHILFYFSCKTYNDFHWNVLQHKTFNPKMQLAIICILYWTFNKKYNLTLFPLSGCQFGTPPAIVPLFEAYFVWIWGCQGE